MLIYSERNKNPLLIPIKVEVGLIQQDREADRREKPVEPAPTEEVFAITLNFIINVTSLGGHTD